MIENNLKVTRFEVAFLTGVAQGAPTELPQTVKGASIGTKYSSSGLYTILHSLTQNSQYPYSRDF